jgi:hypothetical protein
MHIHSVKSIKTWWALAALLILPALAFSLAAQQSKSLIIDGQPGSAKVIQVGGRNYVEVEGLARLTNSSISFNGKQIVLTMPGATSDAPTPASPTTGFSKDFVTAVIEAMAQMREWHAAVKSAIQSSYPLTDNWLATYRSQSLQALRLASVAVNTTSDKDALPFLTNQFERMRKLSDKYLQMTKSLNYIAPDSLDTDPLDQKIRACTRSLASMATANQFVDDGSCQ